MIIIFDCKIVKYNLNACVDITRECIDEYLQSLTRSQVYIEEWDSLVDTGWYILSESGRRRWLRWMWRLLLAYHTRLALYLSHVSHWVKNRKSKTRVYIIILDFINRNAVRIITIVELATCINKFTLHTKNSKNVKKTRISQ